VNIYGDIAPLMLCNLGT